MEDATLGHSGVLLWKYEDIFLMDWGEHRVCGNQRTVEVNNQRKWLDACHKHFILTSQVALQQLIL